LNLKSHHLKQVYQEVPEFPQDCSGYSATYGVSREIYRNCNFSQGNYNLFQKWSKIKSLKIGYATSLNKHLYQEGGPGNLLEK
jgi:hypothetical protein